MGMYIPRGEQKRQIVQSPVQDIDIGAGTTADHVIMRHSRPVKLHAARIVYTDATTGTVAGASVKVGTAVDGAQVVAATNLENTKTVGTSTALTLVATILDADTPVIMRHTGIATTAAGKYYVEIEYEVIS